jgi:hypothetical protein
MNKNQSTAAQRSFICSLARGRSMADLQVILAPAFAVNGNAFDTSATLNQNVARLTKTTASKAIELLKVAA